MLGNEQKIRLLPGDKIQKGKKMKLYIIRHGETSWNKQKKLQGQRDIMLNDAGIRLAELTGEGMKDIDFDLVISSPLIRAKQTIHKNSVHSLIFSHTKILTRKTHAGLCDGID